MTTPIIKSCHLFTFGTPEKIRTPDLLVRSQTLYPAELPALTPEHTSTATRKKQAEISENPKFFGFNLAWQLPYLLIIKFLQLKPLNEYALFAIMGKTAVANQLFGRYRKNAKNSLNDNR